MGGIVSCRAWYFERMDLWFAVLGACFLIWVAATRRGRGMAANFAEALRNAMDNFRGGPPTAMHPSPSNDAALLRRRVEHSL